MTKRNFIKSSMAALTGLTIMPSLLFKKNN